MFIAKFERDKNEFHARIDVVSTDLLCDPDIIIFCRFENYSFSASWPCSSSPERERLTCSRELKMASRRFCCLFLRRELAEANYGQHLESRDLNHVWSKYQSNKYQSIDSDLLLLGQYLSYEWEAVSSEWNRNSDYSSSTTCYNKDGDDDKSRIIRHFEYQ